MQPLVSIITPTTQSRAHFMPRLLAMVASQDYPNIEHIIIDDEDKTVGEKRNMGCERAQGEIILHMDSDDIYASDWVSRSVAGLQGYEVTGLSQILCYDPVKEIAYKYQFADDIHAAYATGATLCYYKAFWGKHKFRHINVGEDMRFVFDAPCNIRSHDYFNGFIATIHSDNTSPNSFSSYRWKKIEKRAINEVGNFKKLLSVYDAE